jgi:hypothetical protein
MLAQSVVTERLDANGVVFFSSSSLTSEFLRKLKVARDTPGPISQNKK